MTHIHYKFSSKLSSDTVVFDGPHVTLRELKRLIMGREKLRSGDCDLQVTNAQTKEEYADDEGLIPKGSSVIVRRIPIIGAKSKSNSKTRNILQFNQCSALTQVKPGVNALKQRLSALNLPKLLCPEPAFLLQDDSVSM
uniref:DWNN domain-containing protein n=1 Tax=Mola mola TaxID=94237 RepID=A0A3Q3WUT7_MOLML